MLRIAASIVCLIAVLGRWDLAMGSFVSVETEFVCPENALCFPEDTEYFKEDALSSFLTRLGYTGTEKFLCSDVVIVGTRRSLNCGQRPVRGIPTYGFRMQVVFWSSKNDIRGIWCNCIREDIALPARHVSDELFFGSVTRFVRGHLLAESEGGLVIDKPRIALMANRNSVPGVDLALKANTVFETPDGTPAEFTFYVDAADGRVIEADDLRKATDRKGFLMDPWDDLGRRLAASPKDLTLFREYQEYGAFRSRGSNEAKYQDEHRNALHQFDPEGESTFSATFAEPLSVDQVLELFSNYDLFVHELFYVVVSDGQVSNRPIENLETAGGSLKGIIQDRLSDQLGPKKDWYLPALSGVPSTGLSSRALQDVRFRLAKIQMNNAEAQRFWRDNRDQLIALRPLVRLNSRLPPTIDELRDSLE